MSTLEPAINSDPAHRASNKGEHRSNEIPSIRNAVRDPRHRSLTSIPSETKGSADRGGGTKGKNLRTNDHKNRNKGDSTNGGNGSSAFNIRNSSVKSTVCMFWKAGKCTKGEQCQFRHTQAFESEPSQQSMSPLKIAKQDYNRNLAYERTAQGASEVAYHILQHKQDALALCNKKYESNIARAEADYESSKENEKRRHALALKIIEQLYERRLDKERAVVTASEQALEVATKEHEGKLAEKKAALEACKAAAAEYKKLEGLQQQAEASATEQYAVLRDSTLLTCGAGLEVQKVVAGFDTCRITIKNFPKEVKRGDVAEMFIQQGMVHSEFLVLNLRAKENHQEATVLAVADHGRAMAIGLDGIKFRDRDLTFKASENSSDDACVLTISWRVPSVIMIATYNSMEEATKNVRDLNGKTCKGQEVRVEMNQPPPTAVLPVKFYNPASVKLIGFPLGICIDQEIYDFAGTSNIKLLKSCTLQDMFNCVLVHLKAFSNMNMDRDELPEPVDGRVVIKVQFQNREDARKAFELFDKKKLLRNSPTLRASLENLVRDRIVISQQQYKAQERQWNFLSVKRPEIDAYVQIQQGDRNDVYMIQVVGEDKKMVGKLKVKVGNMVAGDQLDSNFWHSSFTSSSASGKDFFDRIYTETKVYVRNDFRAKTLKIYGEADAKAKACQMIKEEVDRLAQLETTVTLDQASVGFFMRRGLAQLKDLIGEDKIVHSLDSGRCTITVKGPDENKYHLYRLIEESRTELVFPDQQLKESDQHPCPICTDKILHPEQLGCGHNYCPECLRHYLTSAPETKLFPLACIICKVPIPIPHLRRLLTPQAFRALVETVFSSCMNDPARKLKYCRTADCEQIYLQSDDPQKLNCPVCFSAVCSACDEEPHGDMTCAENKLRKDPTEQDRLFDSWFAANNARQCPGCSTPIEKIDGCNHVTCNRCQTHFCWKCGFKGTGEEIYPHLNQVHGGYFDFMHD